MVYLLKFGAAWVLPPGIFFLAFWFVAWRLYRKKEKRLAEDRIARFEMCFYQDADDFAYQACANGAYAVVLPNGGWQEPGKMGWWGVSSASKDARREWNHSFADQFIRNMPSNRIVTVVDCHI